MPCVDADLIADQTAGDLDVVDAEFGHRGDCLHTVTHDDARLPDSAVIADAAYAVPSGTDTVRRT